MGNFSSNPSNSIGTKWHCPRCTFENFIPDGDNVGVSTTCVGCQRKLRKGEVEEVNSLLAATKQSLIDHQLRQAKKLQEKKRDFRRRLKQKYLLDRVNMFRILKDDKHINEILDVWKKVVKEFVTEIVQHNLEPLFGLTTLMNQGISNNAGGGGARPKKKMKLAEPTVLDEVEAEYQRTAGTPFGHQLRSMIDSRLHQDITDLYTRLYDIPELRESGPGGAGGAGVVSRIRINVSPPQAVGAFRAGGGAGAGAGAFRAGGGAGAGAGGGEREITLNLSDCQTLRFIVTLVRESTNKYLDQLKKDHQKSQRSQRGDYSDPVLAQEIVLLHSKEIQILKQRETWFLKEFVTRMEAYIQEILQYLANQELDHLKKMKERAFEGGPGGGGGGGGGGGEA